MSYLKTILTYNLPSEAEVDRAFLESHGAGIAAGVAASIGAAICLSRGKK
jgi:hypothetical protein